MGHVLALLGSRSVPPSHKPLNAGRLVPQTARLQETFVEVSALLMGLALASPASRPILLSLSPKLLSVGKPVLPIARLQETSGEAFAPLTEPVLASLASRVVTQSQSLKPLNVGRLARPIVLALATFVVAFALPTELALASLESRHVKPHHSQQLTATRTAPLTASKRVTFKVVFAPPPGE
jgi:Na+/serine symporter